MVKYISAEEFAELKDTNVVDVRTPAEFNDQFLPGSTNLPLSDLENSDCEKLNSGGTIYLLCGTGMRAEKAAQTLHGKISQAPVVVKGGIKALDAHGHPLQQGAGKVISLERQVRIVAGGLVVLGVLLGVTVHPGFLALSGFVGAGLTFAGITDTCGMAMMLAKMPWNTKVAA